MKKYSTKKMVIPFFIILLILISFNTFITPFNPYDETWNFQNIYKMYTGGTLYNTSNVIDTPIFFVLGNLLFHVLGANLFVFRIYGILLFLVKYILMFFIFKKLGSNHLLSILYVLLWVTIDSNSIGCSANYNQLALIMCLLGILWYITHHSHKLYHWGQGLVIFLVFFTKQNIGVYYALGLVFFELLSSKFHKKFFLHQFTKLASFLPCLLISLTIMYWQGNLVSFINLCFGSLLEFGSANRAFNIDTLPYLLGMIFVISFSIFIIKSKNTSNELKESTKFLLCLATFLSLIMLPIINSYHTIMSVTFYYLLFIYIIDTLILREVFTLNLHKILLLSICFFIFCAMFIKIAISYFYETINLTHFDKSHPFYNAPISKENLTQLNAMTNYILEKKKSGIDVIVLSYEAAIYMVPLQLNHGALDLLLAGNLGYNGISNTIEQISQMQNTEFLIFTNAEDCFYQEPIEIREYIQNYLKKSGEFLDYSIYINESFML